LDVFEDFLVFLATNEGDSETFGTEATSAANSVQVRVGVAGHVVVEDDVDLLNVDTTSEEIGGHKNTVLEFLEPVVNLDALLLGEVTVHSLGRQGLLVKDLSQLDGVRYGLNENDDLVKVEGVDEVGQLGVLLVLFELHVVLLETVESEFALVLNEDFRRVAHELLAGVLDVSGEGGGEHHDLLVVGSLLENVLDVSSHVHLFSAEQSVTLIKNKHLEVAQVEVLLADELKDTARGSHDDVWRLKALQEFDVILDGLSTVDDISAYLGHVLGEALELILDLVGQLTGMAEDDGAAGLGVLR